MAVEPSALRRELIGFAGIVERNVYLIRRFAWWELAWFLYTVANTLTIVFIAKGIEQAGGKIDVNRATIVLLVGAVIWSYLGLIFEVVTETERVRPRREEQDGGDAPEAHQLLTVAGQRENTLARLCLCEAKAD